MREGRIAATPPRCIAPPPRLARSTKLLASLACPPVLRPGAAAASLRPACRAPPGGGSRRRRAARRPAASPSAPRAQRACRLASRYSTRSTAFGAPPGPASNMRRCDRAARRGLSARRRQRGGILPIQGARTPPSSAPRRGLRGGAVAHFAPCASAAIRGGACKRAAHCKTPVGKGNAAGSPLDPSGDPDCLNSVDVRDRMISGGVGLVASDC
jgi:hypothetical protein